MRVLAVVPSLYDTSPGQRFRIEQWEPILRQKGVDISYAPFETPELKSVLHQSGQVFSKFRTIARNLSRRRDDVTSASGYDLIYLFREAAVLGPPWFERKLAKAGIPIVFDFDDAIFHSYKSPSNGYLSYLKFPSKAAETCRISTHIMAGNQYLADYALKYNANVSIVPTTIDISKYTIEERPDPEVLTIGWSGSFSTIQHLDTIREALRELAKIERFRLRVIGAANYELDGVDVDALHWRSETEIDDLREIDIGLMPLPDEKWSRGKCGLKALQYMALGIPTICSPVGVNSTIIKDGQNGFLASATDEWVAVMKRLLHSPELRRTIGMAGRATVESEYSAEVAAPQVFEIFQSAAAKGQNV